MFTAETCTGVLFSWGRCENHKSIAAIFVSDKYELSQNHFWDKPLKFSFDI